MSNNDTNNKTEPVNLELQPCKVCGRTFIPITLVKHIKICEKMLAKKRKTFDSSRQRREGTDLASYLPKNFGLPLSKTDPEVSSKQTQKQKSHLNTSQEPPSPKMEALKHNDLTINEKQTLNQRPKTSPLIKKVKTNLSEQQCFYCGRCFGPKAYDRHVEWCKEKSLISTPSPNSVQTAAKKKLEARTKYRAPNLRTKNNQENSKENLDIALDSPYRQLLTPRSFESSIDITKSPRKEYCNNLKTQTPRNETYSNSQNSDSISCYDGDLFYDGYDDKGQLLSESESCHVTDNEENSLLSIRTFTKKMSTTYQKSLHKPTFKESSLNSEEINNITRSQSHDSYQSKRDFDSTYGSSKSETRMANFCYECGCKFSICTAKFCIECGIKRIPVE